MRRRLIIYGALVLVLTGVGLAISLLAFDDAAGGADDPAAGLESAAAPPVARPAAARADAGRDAAPAIESVEVVAVEGQVKRSDRAGEWSELLVGQLLDVDESVQTREDSQVTLRVGTESTIEVAENAEVRVREVSESVQRFGLIRGRISADYQGDGERVLRVENEDGSAVAEVRRKGAFSVLSTGTTVAVATETGSVDLSAAGETVAVGAGTQSVVRGGAPSRPTAIPVDVMLRVVDPGCRTQREAVIAIQGRASPGSSVRVNNVTAEVSADGKFSARVPLVVGRNRIVVVSEDVLGRVKRRTFPCVTVDPGAAIKKIDIKWGSAKKREGS
jgi:hypothetical protein